MDSKPLSINELKDAFFSLKINKSSGVDDVSFNIIKKCFGVLCEPLHQHITVYQRTAVNDLCTPVYYSCALLFTLFFLLFFILGHLYFTLVTFFMSHFFHVALFSCCPLFVFHFGQAALIPCCTFYMFHPFILQFLRVTLFSYCTNSMLHFFSCYTLFILNLFGAALFSWCTLFELQLFAIALFSGSTFSVMHFFHLILFS